MKLSDRKNGFTIVELLIVIVVIGILAAITIVAYNGVSDRAKTASIQSDLENTAKSLEISKTTSATGQYPVDQASAALKPSSGASMTYGYISATNGYCVTEINGTTSYFITSASSNSQKGTCSGMMGWYPLNGNTNDMSGNGHSATASGALPTTDQSGKIGAYNLNGAANDFIDTGYSYATDQLTASIWVLPDGTGINSFATILSNSRDCCSTNRGFQIAYVRTAPYQLTSELWSGTIVASSDIANGLTMNSWTNIGLTFDGTTLRTYRNGTQIATASYSGTLGTPLWNLFIGRMGEGQYGYNFGGKVDDVRIFNRGLSAAEMQSLYSNGPI